MLLLNRGSFGNSLHCVITLAMLLLSSIMNLTWCEDTEDPYYSSQDESCILALYL